MNTLIKENIQLKPYNTFGFDIVAPYFAEFSSTVELSNVIQECRDRGLEWYVLGGGSNIIFRGGFGGVLLHSVADSISVDGGDIVIGDAGVEWDRFVGWCVEQGWCGLENLSYIPGSVGASPVQNIGAYGAQAGDFVEWVEYFDAVDMTTKRILGVECEFGYRESIFKGELRGRAIITRVGFRLSRDFKASLDYGDLRSVVEGMSGGATPQNVRQAVTEIRRQKLPEPTELGNAGSFFKNPVVGNDVYEGILKKHPDAPCYTVDPQRVKIPAGWMIDMAGLRGYRRGSVGVHERQALVLVNYGGGSAGDILGLAEYVMATVFEEFGVRIEMEVNVL